MLFPSVTPISLNNDLRHRHGAYHGAHLDASAFDWRHAAAEAQASLATQSELSPIASPVGSTVGSPTERARALAAVLLAGALAALMVAADQLIDIWTADHLLMGWVALWTVAFAGMAFLVRPMRALSLRVATAWVAWQHRYTLRQQDAQFWADAQRDPRLMADLNAAHARATGA